MSDELLRVRVADAMHLAARLKASDLHVVPSRPFSLRVNGELRFIDGEPLSVEHAGLIARMFLGATTLERIAVHGDASVTSESDSRMLMRIHGYRAQGGIALAIRLLSTNIPPLASLHLPDSVRALANRQRGLIIFAGPTGSGKSTSMAALLAAINETSARRIITIEDPIEYRHETGQSIVTQREIGRDVPSFASAVVGALRADPDVIMIGEMRERATMRAAITAAETGHLVLSTLHTGDAVQTIDRILDAFAGAEQAQVRAQLAASLLAVVCQRLVPRRDGSGRRVSAEVLVATEAVRTTIREARTHQLRNLMLTGRQFGMQTLEHHLSELLSERAIDRATAEACTERHDELRANVVPA